MPDEIWRGSPEEEIDTFNFEGPRNRIYGTAQENAYLAEQASREDDFVTNAIRQRGTQKFQQLIRDGARPEEALLLAAPDLFAGNPRAMERAVSVATKRPSSGTEYEPQFTETPYGTVFRSGPGSARLLENKESPELLARRRLLEDEIKTLQRAAADPLKSATIDTSRLNALKQEYWGTFPAQSAPVAPSMPAESAPGMSGRTYMGSASGEPESMQSRGRMFMGNPEDEPAIEAPVTAPRAPVTAPSAAPSPYKEGQYVRSKKDRKLYQIVNGRPVLVR